jgi:hypothetical protein
LHDGYLPKTATKKVADWMAAGLCYCVAIPFDNTVKYRLNEVRHFSFELEIGNQKYLFENTKLTNICQALVLETIAEYLKERNISLSLHLCARAAVLNASAAGDLFDIILLTSLTELEDKTLNGKAPFDCLPNSMHAIKLGSKLKLSQANADVKKLLDYNDSVCTICSISNHRSLFIG